MIGNRIHPVLSGQVGLVHEHGPLRGLWDTGEKETAGYNTNLNARNKHLIHYKISCSVELSMHTTTDCHPVQSYNRKESEERRHILVQLGCCWRRKKFAWNKITIQKCNIRHCLLILPYNRPVKVNPKCQCQLTLE